MLLGYLHYLKMTLLPTPPLSTALPSFSLVAAVSKEHGIGFKNNLPWKKRLNIDMTFFRFLTSTSWLPSVCRVCEQSPSVSDNLPDGLSNEATSVANGLMDDPSSEISLSNWLIMGRKTFESVTKQLGCMPPFKGRKSLVLSRSNNL